MPAFCWERGAKLLEFRFLRVARERDAAPLIGGVALLQRRVVELRHSPQHAIKFLLLFGVGLSLYLKVLRRLSSHGYFSLFVSFGVLA